MQVLGLGLPQARTQPQGLAFFGKRPQVVADVSVLAGRLQQDATRLSAGLATWVTRLQVPSGLFRVVDTAGLGKTLLALCLLKDVDAARQKQAEEVRQTGAGSLSPSAKFCLFNFSIVCRMGM